MDVIDIAKAGGERVVSWCGPELQEMSVMMCRDTAGLWWGAQDDSRNGAGGAMRRVRCRAPGKRVRRYAITLSRLLEQDA